MNADTKTRFLFAAALLQIFWGLVPSASKFVIDEIPIELYITLRWTISALIFGIYVFCAKSWRRVSWSAVAPVSLLGILGYGLASFASLSGLKIGGVTNFAMIGALSPAITSVACILILKERPRQAFYIALPLSIFGLTLLVAGKHQLTSLAIASESALYIVGGMTLEALVFFYSKKFKSQMTASQYLLTAQAAAALFSWLLQLVFFRQGSELAHLTWTGASATLFVSIVACVLCYSVHYWLLTHTDGHRLALFDGFHAVSATVFGIVFFHEQLTVLMVLGGIVILGCPSTFLHAPSRISD